MIAAPPRRSPAHVILLLSLLIAIACYGQTASKATATSTTAPKTAAAKVIPPKAPAPKVSTANSSVSKATTPKPPAPKAIAPASSPAQGLKASPPPLSLAVPRVNSPTMPRLGYAKYPWKTDIVATVFWVGEQPTENNPTPNNKSSWDTEWEKNFGGYDDPDATKRGTNYCPVGFTPKLNPFYIALPYNDCLDYTDHKPEAARVIPWFKERFVRKGKTVLRGTWLAIRYGNRVCYAQWEDCGPFVTDDYEYVFGTARPKNTSNRGAGLDISPAVRDYLGMSSSGKCDWRFVDVAEVPPGPWRSMGTNNHFVRAQTEQKAQQTQDVASRLEELKRMRDAYFKQNGNSSFQVR